MYRENTFEALKSKDDKFNFNKVLQKRREFFKHNLPTRAEDGTIKTKAYQPNTKLQYNNEDFINNLHDRHLVSEITGGDPTYNNKVLYRNLESNLQKMSRVKYPKSIFDMTATNDTRIDQSYQQHYSTDFSNLGAETSQSQNHSKVDICVGDNDIKIIDRDLLRPHVSSNRSMKTGTQYNSVEKMLLQK